MPSIDTYKRMMTQDRLQRMNIDIPALYATAKITGYTDTYDNFKKQFEKIYEEVLTASNG